MQSKTNKDLVKLTLRGRDAAIKTIILLSYLTYEAKIKINYFIAFTT